MKQQSPVERLYVYSSPTMTPSSGADGSSNAQVVQVARSAVSTGSTHTRWMKA
jgi:hypothetical protein